MGLKSLAKAAGGFAANIGTLASGVGSLASGFGLGQSAKQGVDYTGAKKGIRWRVKDAKKAGIHPLYAIGAPGVGTGQVLGSQGTDPGAGLQGLGSALSGYAETQQRNRQIEQQAARNEAEIAYTQAQTDYVRQQTQASQAHMATQAAGHGPQPTPSRFESPAGSLKPGMHTPAEQYQQQYGDIAEEVAGGLNLAHDLAYKAYAGERHPHVTNERDIYRYHSRKYRSRSGRNARNAGKWRYQ